MASNSTFEATEGNTISQSLISDPEPPRDPISLVKDPLSEVTRNERRTLLGISAIGIAMIKANLIPQKISALGIDFQEINQSMLLRSVAVLILYFLIAFILYSISDFLLWRIAYRQVIRELIESTIKSKELNLIEQKNYFSNDIEQRIIDRSVGPVSLFRALFEFVFPIFVAGYAIYILI